MIGDLGVWTFENSALVLIDYQKEMFEAIRSETSAPLASEEASYVTGVDVVVDGGMRVW